MTVSMHRNEVSSACPNCFIKFTFLLRHFRSRKTPKKNKVCHLLRIGVGGIFGPQSAHTASHVQSICDTMEVPHLETRWDYRLRRENCLVNLYPHPSVLSRVSRISNLFGEPRFEFNFLFRFEWPRLTLILWRRGAGNRSPSFMRRTKVWCDYKNCSKLMDHRNFRSPYDNCLIRTIIGESQERTKFERQKFIFLLSRPTVLCWNKSRIRRWHILCSIAAPTKSTMCSSSRNKLEWWAIITAIWLHLWWVELSTEVDAGWWNRF